MRIVLRTNLEIVCRLHGHADWFFRYFLAPLSPALCTISTQLRYAGLLPHFHSLLPAFHKERPDLWTHMTIQSWNNTTIVVGLTYFLKQMWIFFFLMPWTKTFRTEVYNIPYTYCTMYTHACMRRCVWVCVMYMYVWFNLNAHRGAFMLWSYRELVSHINICVCMLSFSLFSSFSIYLYISEKPSTQYTQPSIEM